MEGVDFSVKAFLLKDINMLEVFVFCFFFANGLLGALPFKHGLPETCLLIIVLFPLSFFFFF